MALCPAYEAKRKLLSRQRERLLRANKNRSRTLGGAVPNGGRPMPISWDAAERPHWPNNYRRARRDRNCQSEMEMEREALWSRIHNMRRKFRWRRVRRLRRSAPVQSFLKHMFPGKRARPSWGRAFARAFVAKHRQERNSK